MYKLIIQLKLNTQPGLKHTNGENFVTDKTLAFSISCCNNILKEGAVGVNNISAAQKMSILNEWWLPLFGGFIQFL